MENIEHIVYLMLENRSFDNVLGWLYENDAPDHIILSTNGSFDGLQPSFSNPDGNGRRVFVSKVPANNNQTIPSVDPNEEFQHVQTQIANGMQGFYEDFSDCGSANPSEIMECFTAESLPVLNSLAKQFAVSDAYFSSIPSQTNCNRAFAATGNSLGYYYNSNELKAWVNNSFGEWEKWALDVTFNQKTIWGVLNENNFSTSQDWMIFYNQTWPGHLPIPGNYCFTQDLFWPTLQSNSSDNFGDLTQFHDRAKNGTLPTFSFLEPAWCLEKYGFGWNGNDYHPPGNLGCGEQFLHEIYSALQSSPTWANTLLIINFDEHGGTYDHVTPPNGVNAPWDNPNDGTPLPNSTEYGFHFHSLGVRVPLILVSPLIEEKTVIRSGNPQVPFDHTSVIATILNHFGINKTKWGLGSRTVNAPTFENVITLSPDKARLNVNIKSPISTTCNSGEDFEPNDLQRMIMRRYLVRMCNQMDFSLERFRQLYEQYFNDVKTMQQLNEAAKNVMIQIKLEAANDKTGKKQT